MTLDSSPNFYSHFQQRDRCGKSNGLLKIPGGTLVAQVAKKFPGSLNANFIVMVNKSEISPTEPILKRMLL